MIVLTLVLDVVVCAVAVTDNASAAVVVVVAMVVVELVSELVARPFIKLLQQTRRHEIICLAIVIETARD